MKKLDESYSIIVIHSSAASLSVRTEAEKQHARSQLQLTQLKVGGRGGG